MNISKQKYYLFGFLIASLYMGAQASDEPLIQCILANLTPVESAKMSDTQKLYTVFLNKNNGLETRWYSIDGNYVSPDKYTYSHTLKSGTISMIKDYFFPKISYLTVMSDLSNGQGVYDRDLRAIYSVSGNEIIEKNDQGDLVPNGRLAVTSAERWTLSDTRAEAIFKGKIIDSNERVERKTATGTTWFLNYPGESPKQLTCIATKAINDKLVKQFKVDNTNTVSSIVRKDRDHNICRFDLVYDPTFGSKKIDLRTIQWRVRSGAVEIKPDFDKEKTWKTVKPTGDSRDIEYSFEYEDLAALSNDTEAGTKHYIKVIVDQSLKLNPKARIEYRKESVKNKKSNSSIEDIQCKVNPLDEEEKKFEAPVIAEQQLAK